MVSAASEYSAPSEGAPLFPTFEIGPFAEFNARNLATSMNAGTAVMRGAATYWGHIGDFMYKRLQSDAEAFRALSACRCGEEAAKTQRAFVSTMISDYFNGMHAVLTIGAEIAKGVAEPIESRAEEAMRDIDPLQKLAAE
ncbi:MAG: phasin family protein [Amphiplicatus sp.]